MTRDEIIRLSFKSGREVDIRFTPEQLDSFVALVAAHEREECAKVCDAVAEKSMQISDTFAPYEIAEQQTIHGAMIQAQKLAAAIRARGETK